MVRPIPQGNHNKSKHSSGTQKYYNTKGTKKLKPRLVVCYKFYDMTYSLEMEQAIFLQLPVPTLGHKTTNNNTVRLSAGFFSSMPHFLQYQVAVSVFLVRCFILVLVFIQWTKSPEIQFQFQSQLPILVLVLVQSTKIPEFQFWFQSQFPSVLVRILVQSE